MSSADNLCAQFGPRSGLHKVGPDLDSGSKLFDTSMIFLKEFFEKDDFEKNQQTTKKHAKLPRMQRIKKKILLTEELSSSMLSGLRGEKKGLKPFLFLMPSSLASPGSGTLRKQLPAD